MTDTAVLEDAPKKVKRGNPLMRAITDADLANNRQFVFSKLDTLFAKVEDGDLITPALWKEYLAWRKDSVKREKFAKAQKLKAQFEATGLTPEELLEMLKSA